jgi:hypothetical protein
MLGEVGKGAHSYRVANIAIVDVIFTFLGAYIIWAWIYPKYSYYFVLAMLFLLGIILHRLFCVRTTIDKLLFSRGGFVRFS